MRRDRDEPAKWMPGRDLADALSHQIGPALKTAVEERLADLSEARAARPRETARV